MAQTDTAQPIVPESTNVRAVDLGVMRDAEVALLYKRLAEAAVDHTTAVCAVDTTLEDPLLTDRRSSEAVEGPASGRPALVRALGCLDRDGNGYVLAADVMKALTCGSQDGMFTESQAAMVLGRVKATKAGLICIEALAHDMLAELLPPQRKAAKKKAKKSRG